MNFFNPGQRNQANSFLKLMSEGTCFAYTIPEPEFTGFLPMGGYNIN